MAQDYIMIQDDNDVWQRIFTPDEGLEFSFETTYTEDSTRTQDGGGHFSPMFTVESFGYSASWVPAAEVHKILQLVIGRQFPLHYYSPYFGAWRDDMFYVGKGSMKIGRLNEDEEIFESLSFNMVGLNPIV